MVTSPVFFSSQSPKCTPGKRGLGTAAPPSFFEDLGRVGILDFQWQEEKERKEGNEG